LNEKVYAIPLTVAIKGIVPIDKQFEVYGLAGTGAYFVNGKATASATVRGVSASVSFSDNTTVWGGFLGAGATYNITPQVFVGLEGKYLWTSSANLSDTVAGVRVNADFKIRGAFATANVGFRF
jgi:opacity protein-like surface antigen